MRYRRLARRVATGASWLPYAAAMFAPDRYVAALWFAAARHHGQTVPGTERPYLVHVTSVAAEVIAALPGSGLDADLAVVCALLHDTLEDTAGSDGERRELADDLADRFGPAVRDGVAALSKRDRDDDGAPIAKADRMADSLRRIREQPHAVWAVKLADRITNLAPPPPHWPLAKCAAYRAEAQVIVDALADASPALAARLRARIASYARYGG